MKEKKDNEGFIMMLRNYNKDLDDWLWRKPLRYRIFIEMTRRARRTDHLYDGLSPGEFFFSEREYYKFNLKETQKTQIRTIISSFIKRELIEKIKSKVGRSGALVYRLINKEIFDINIEDKELSNEQTTNKQRTNNELIKTNNNDNNDKNISVEAVASTVEELFNLREWKKKLRENPQKHIKIVAWYCQAKEIEPTSHETARATIDRWVKPASLLTPWTSHQLNNCKAWLEDEGLSWTLETIVKNISQYHSYKQGNERMTQAEANEWVSEDIAFPKR